MAAGKPNILLVFADDLGWKDVGYQGAEFNETPNIDRLAGEGMVFTAGYASAGNCAPSRACLLSGQYTPRHEVYAVNRTDRGPRNLMRLVPIPNKSGLAREKVTVADALKAAGYATGIFGKWHLDGPDGSLPGEQGFATVHESFHTWNSREPEAANPKGIYSLTAAAGEFMAANRDRPFFAYVSHYAVHTAYQARASSLAKFKAKSPRAAQRDALFAACLYDLDDGVGILLKKLEELGLARNTLVIFTSDNGGTSLQEPLRGNKGGYYEGGIRVPFIARWTGTIEPGSGCDVPVIFQDFYPTFLALAAATPPRGTVLDGESLVPLLRQSGPLRREAIFWHFPGYLDKPVTRGRDPVFRTRPVSVIRKGDWKLHLYHEEWQLDGGRERLATNDAVELYNMREDRSERRNVAATQPRKRDELLSDLLAWIETSGAKIPAEINLAYAPDASPAPAESGQKRAGVGTDGGR